MISTVRLRVVSVCTKFTLCISIFLRAAHRNRRMADPDARARKHDAPVSRRPGRALAAAFCTAADEVRDCSRPRTHDKGQSHEVLKPPQLASPWSSLHSRFLSREGRLQPRARRSRALTATSENRPSLDFFWESNPWSSVRSKDLGMRALRRLGCGPHSASPVGAALAPGPWQWRVGTKGCRPLKLAQKMQKQQRNPRRRRRRKPSSRRRRPRTCYTSRIWNQWKLAQSRQTLAARMLWS